MFPCKSLPYLCELECCEALNFLQLNTVNYGAVSHAAEKLQCSSRQISRLRNDIRDADATEEQLNCLFVPYPTLRTASDVAWRTSSNGPSF